MSEPAGPPNEPRFTKERIASLITPTVGHDVALQAVAEALRSLRLDDGPLDVDHARAVVEQIARADGLVGSAARFALARATFLRAPSSRPAPRVAEPSRPRRDRSSDEPIPPSPSPEDPAPTTQRGLDPARYRHAPTPDEGIAALRRSSTMIGHGAHEDAMAALRRSRTNLTPNPPPAAPIPRASSARDLAALMTASLGDAKGLDVVRTAMRKLSLQEPLDQDAAERVLESLSQEPGIVGITARLAKTRFGIQRG